MVYFNPSPHLMTGLALILIKDTILSQQNIIQPPLDQRQLTQMLAALSIQVRDLFEQKKFQQAQPLIQQVLMLVPNHPIALMNLATTDLRLGHYQAAYDAFKHAMSVMDDHIDTFIYCGLAETCRFLNKTDEQAYYGRLAIAHKKRLVQHHPVIALPETHPPKFNPYQSTENIISYSLFGGLPRYCEVAIHNVQIAKAIYPEWTCRFYVDDAVPENILKRLSQNGAQIYHVKNTMISGFFWRFLVMDDPSVKRFLIRDADSLLSYRERAAVDEWLNSDRWFHVMRDFYSHTELILAGMWGGCTGVFKHNHRNIEQFIQNNLLKNQITLDQEYLRECVWPTIQHSLMTHDSQHYDEQALDFPTPSTTFPYERENFHIGANEGAYTIKVTLQQTPTQHIVWVLKNQQHQEICRYTLEINYAQTFSLCLPRLYVERILAQDWYIETYDKK